MTDDMNLYAFTVDVDWAPECAVEALRELFVKYQVKCTWFLTHDSKEVRRIFEHPELFELGVHPNFLPGSSHGSTEDEVMLTMRKLLPNSPVIRTHCLIQSSRLFAWLIEKHRIRIDASLFLRETPNIVPHTIRFSESGADLLRIPYFWEDDVEMYNPAKSWDPKHSKYHMQGLKVFNFHPTYVYLNGDLMTPYEELKKCGPLNGLDRDIVDSFVNEGQGAGTLFRGLLSFLRMSATPTYTLSEIAEKFLSHSSRAA